MVAQSYLGGFYYPEFPIKWKLLVEPNLYYVFHLCFSVNKESKGRRRLSLFQLEAPPAEVMQCVFLVSTWSLIPTYYGGTKDTLFTCK